MELKVTRYEIDDAGIATVWLHRPERRNSWTGRMHTEYRWICKRLEDDPHVRVIVLTGSGESFCVGADRDALAGFVEAGRYDTALDADAEQPGYGVRPEFDADVTWQLGLRVPMIAAVNGACAGIAVALAAFCDLRFASADAVLTTAFARIGLASEYGMGWILNRVTGHANAFDLLLSARKVRGAEALRLGLVNNIHPADELAAATHAYARDLAENVSPRSLRVMKRQLWELPFQTLHEALISDSSEMLQANACEDFKEGKQAFMEKRPPKFTGE